MADQIASPSPDYYARALALWPRLGHPHSVRTRHDPNRLAAMIARRTNLSVTSILSLIGASDEDASAPGRGN